MLSGDGVCVGRPGVWCTQTAFAVICMSRLARICVIDSCMISFILCCREVQDNDAVISVILVLHFFHNLKASNVSVHVHRSMGGCILNCHC